MGYFWTSDMVPICISVTYPGGHIQDLECTLSCCFKLVTCHVPCCPQQARNHRAHASNCLGCCLPRLCHRC
jgi:hypothetical protein